jgi:hypothetical protein
MPTNRKTPIEDAQHPDTALLEAAVSGAVVTEIHLDYVGPDYDLGIQIHGRKDLVRPREFTPAEIADFTEKYPSYTHWWFPAGK